MNVNVSTSVGTHDAAEGGVVRDLCACFKALLETSTATGIRKSKKENEEVREIMWADESVGGRAGVSLGTSVGMYSLDTYIFTYLSIVTWFGVLYILEKFSEWFASCYSRWMNWWRMYSLVR